MNANRLTLAAFVLVLGGFFLLKLILPQQEFSFAERRPLNSLPDMSLESLASGEFMDEFEGYAADSFPFRDGFRAVRAGVALGAFRMSDKDGIYVDSATGIGKFEKINAASLRLVARKMEEAVGVVGDCNIYMAFVPDKSAYASTFYPGFDMDEASSFFEGALPNAMPIDLSGSLSADSYYKTDLHWSQPALGRVVEALGQAMSFSVKPLDSFKTFGSFNGVYKGQLALPTALVDSMDYIEITGATALYYSEAGSWEEGEIYSKEGFESVDPYNFFLRGPCPAIQIENPNALEDRTLYLFRDSFSSSLAPLLAQSYKNLVCIDLRYLSANALAQLVDFKPGSDVLFLYGSLFLNSFADWE
ncbi:MAG: hypothetical protein LBC41_17015 [Clostridiales bacterium]|jgi:hypothetical protein|nr:hypothetical protein [Clostridiales bacterium]